MKKIVSVLAGLMIIFGLASPAQAETDPPPPEDQVGEYCLPTPQQPYKALTQPRKVRFHGAVTCAWRPTLYEYSYWQLQISDGGASGPWRNFGTVWSSDVRAVVLNGSDDAVCVPGSYKYYRGRITVESAIWPINYHETVIKTGQVIAIDCV